MIDQIMIQQKFETLLGDKFTQLNATNKWRQTMWHIDGSLVVSLVHLSKKSKFCFFNNPNLNLGTIQRWGSTTYSNNLEIKDEHEVDWTLISDTIATTIHHHTSQVK